MDSFHCLELEHLYQVNLIETVGTFWKIYLRKEVVIF